MINKNGAVSGMIIDWLKPEENVPDVLFLVELL
jgi:hypothetical protein